MGFLGALLKGAVEAPGVLLKGAVEAPGALWGPAGGVAGGLWERCRKSDIGENLPCSWGRNSPVVRSQQRLRTQFDSQ